MRSRRRRREAATVRSVECQCGQPSTPSDTETAGLNSPLRALGVHRRPTASAQAHPRVVAPGLEKGLRVQFVVRCLPAFGTEVCPPSSGTLIHGWDSYLSLDLTATPSSNMHAESRFPS